MMENGKLITCMGKEYILGKMEEYIRVNISMIRNMVSVLILGLMVDVI